MSHTPNYALLSKPNMNFLPPPPPMPQNTPSQSSLPAFLTPIIPSSPPQTSIAIRNSHFIRSFAETQPPLPLPPDLFLIDLSPHNYLLRINDKQMNRNLWLCEVSSFEHSNFGLLFLSLFFGNVRNQEKKRGRGGGRKQFFFYFA
jgi:hypothetical protein